MKDMELRKCFINLKENICLLEIEFSTDFVPNSVESPLKEQIEKYSKYIWKVSGELEKDNDNITYSDLAFNLVPYSVLKQEKKLDIGTFTECFYEELTNEIRTRMQINLSGFYNG